MQMRVILASSSPRRKELMNMLGIPYEVISYDHDEVLNKEKTVYEQCMDISYQKGKIVYDSFNEDVVVISSDTIVVLDNEIYGKPIDRLDAYKMLVKLQGKTHEVVSALTVFYRKGDKEVVKNIYEKALVTVDSMSDDEINSWIDTGKAFGKAGAYAIQEEYGRFIKKIDGDYYTIVGLPINKLYNILKELEVYDGL
jgi:septum formation protein